MAKATISSPPRNFSRVITVFGSSRCAEDSEPYRTALELGEALARAGFAVATGGYGGIMAAVSRGANQAGGRVIGVASESFSRQCNAWVNEPIVVNTWQERLFRLIELGGGYIACEGGTGTLVELAVVWEMAYKRVASYKPMAALGSFWEPIIEYIEAAEPGARGIVRQTRTVPEAVDFLRTSVAAG